MYTIVNKKTHDSLARDMIYDFFLNSNHITIRSSVADGNYLVEVHKIGRELERTAEYLTEYIYMLCAEDTIYTAIADHVFKLVFSDICMALDMHINEKKFFGGEKK